MAALRNATPFTYRQDPAVPAFPDDKPIFIFDGYCVLCSGGATWLMRHDKKRIFRMSTAQSSLGAALYAHYGIDWDATYLLISNGLPYTKSGGYLHMCAVVGGWWKAVLILHLIPRALRDAHRDRGAEQAESGRQAGGAARASRFEGHAARHRGGRCSATSALGRRDVLHRRRERRDIGAVVMQMHALY